MNELHLFAGAGGGILGGMLLGHTTVCAVEIEPSARKILLQRQKDGILPRFPIWDDVSTFDGKPWRGRVDVVCGGFPCQDISIANPNGKGIEGERSGLWAEQARIIREVRPRKVFVENSSELVGRGLAVVISDLAEMGYTPRWCVLGGHAAGSISNGERLWLLADEGDGNGWETASLQSRIVNSEESLRRQFERASGSFVSQETYANELRSTDEVSDWMDRIKAIGNAQDPVLAATAWQFLS